MLSSDPTPLPLAYYIHHLDPYIFRLGFLQPRWYGVAYLMGFLCAYLLIKKLSRDGMLRLNPERVPDLVLNCCIFGVLVGGRLGFVLFYDLPHALAHHMTPLLWEFSGSFPYWGLLRVNDGGMSAHGGIVFTVLTLIWFGHKYRKQGGSIVNIGDAACMVVPIGLFFGRCANFINGELYGHPTSVPWAVKFPSEIWSPTNNVPTVSPAGLSATQSAVAQYLSGHWGELTRAQVEAFLSHHRDCRDMVLEKLGPLHLNDASQLEAVKHVIGSFVQLPQSVDASDLASFWIGPHTGLTDVLYHWFDVILPARHPSQLYEALLEGALLFIICWTVGRVWRKDGMASGAFLTFYPVMRIIGEQFRVGDTSISLFGLPVGEGVWLSLPLFIVGALYWGYWIKRDRRFAWVPHGAAPAPEPGGTAPAADSNST